MLVSSQNTTRWTRLPDRTMPSIEPMKARKKS